MKARLSLEEFLKKRLPKKQYEELMEDYYLLKVYEHRKHEKSEARPVEELREKVLGRKTAKKRTA